MFSDSRPIPVLHSTVAPEPLLGIVAATYELDDAVGCTLVRAWTNDVYTVTTRRETFILKVYRAAWRSFEDVAWETHLQAFLANRGAPVTPVRARPDGQLFSSLLAPEGMRCLALFEHAQGAKPRAPLTPDLYYHVGQAAAQLHAQSDGFSAPCPRPPLDLSAILDRPLEMIRPWLEGRSDDWHFLLQLADSIRTRLTPLFDQGVDWGICHGDLSLDNCHVTAGGAVTFYDFDQSGYGPRGLDVCGVFAYAVQENPGIWDAFLKGYTQVRPFSKRDQEATRWCVGANSFRMMAAEITNWSHWFGTARVWTWIENELAWLRRWEVGQLQP
jgi:Ser/Thr protein kinase RdoA (MazF antagonist)